MVEESKRMAMKTVSVTDNPMLDKLYYKDLQEALNQCDPWAGSRDGSYYTEAKLFFAARVEFPFLCNQLLKPPYFFSLIPRFDVVSTATGDEIVFNAPKRLSQFVAAYRASQRYGKPVKYFCLLVFVIYIKIGHYLSRRLKMPLREAP